MRAVRFPGILVVRKGEEPLYLQIARQLEHSICAGTLRPGARLPSTRSLARMLGVSRNTVLIAYETLAAANLICSRHGSGARVNSAAALTLPPMADVLSAAMYPKAVSLFTDPDGNRIHLRHPERAPRR